jgi:hypothetical protein
MAKRRKSRKLNGLGGSSKHHAEAAHNEANHALRAFSLSERSQSCMTAISHFVGGVRSAGSAMTHRVEAKGTVAREAGGRTLDNRYNELYAAEDEALAHIVRVCHISK